MSSPVMVSSGPLGRLQGRWQPSGTTSRPSEASRNGLVYVDDEMEVLDEEEEEEDDEYLEDEEDDEEQALADEDEELDDDSSTFTSSPSIPDENIDFTLVYTLHTFEATVEGQASVLKGDSLTLLDDSNSYWWLVKVLKTNEVGYIPAENIETPFERLARLNKHRNVEVTSMQQAAHYISEASNAQGKKPKKAKNVTMSKMNAFQSYIILIGENDDDIEERYEEYEDEMVDEDSQSTVLASDDPGDNAEMGHDDADEDPEDEEFLQGVPASPIAADEHQVQALDIVSSSSPSSADATNASDILSTISSTSSSADHAPQTNVQPTSSNRTPTPQQNAATSPNASKKHPFLKIFSRKQKDGRKPQQGIMSPGPDQASLHSNVSLDRPENQLQSPSQPQSQPQARPTMKLDASATVLRVYAGNINVNATYNSVLVNDVTNAEQLLHLAMDRFHISQIEGKTRNAESARRSSSSHAPGSGVEYYLTVKSLDGEELTLLPQDKPLSMYQSLTAHLTTPMPSLASLKEQVTKVEHSRIGSPLHHAHGRRSGLRFNEDSVRFYLHKRIRRMNEREGQIYVKVSLYQEDPSTHSTSSKKRSTSGSSTNLADNKSGKKSVASKTSSSPKRNNTSFAVRRTKSTSGSSSNKLPKNKPAPSQIDKLIAVSTLTTVAELLDIALEKFHLLQQAEHQAHPPPRYRITLSLGQQGKNT
ncbi:hypothetical protein BC940DRAFT_97276 [Gongronella butleri]|nr:hypothetical protein BC940DRAFT_97276 [Gongronella butleri]